MKKVALLFLCLGFVGCDDDDKKDASGDAAVADASTAANSVSTRITAAAGGTVKLDQVTLVIPPGALAADTTITIASSAPSSSLPDQASISGMVYDFGPDGTTFTKPVSLTLPVSGAIPQGKSAVCAFLDTTKGAWVELPGSASGATVTCQTTHFTKFALRFVGPGGTCAFGGACGGDLAGTWDITEICLPKKEPTGIDICKTDTASTLSILGGKGSLAVTGTSYTLNIDIDIKAVYSPACLAPYSQMITSCNDVSAQLIKSFKGTATCTGTLTTGCTCTATLPQKSDTGTLVIAGTTAKFIKTGETADTTTATDFCVKGTALEVKSTKSDKPNADGGAPTIETTVYKAIKR